MTERTFRLGPFKYENIFAHVQDDLISGVTIALVALPLALGFAVASGVDAKVGLYTAIVTGVVGSLLGGSRYNITGPTGGMAAILAGIVVQYGIEKVWIAGVMSGLMLVVAGLLKLGKLVKFIPYPVVVGFTNGIGVIIFCGQLNNFFGLKLERHEHFVENFVDTFTHLGQLNVLTVGIALMVVAIQFTWLRLPWRAAKKLPGSLVALVIATVIASTLHLSVPTIGAIPQSLPQFQMIDFWHDWNTLRDLVNPAIAIAALAGIESLLCGVVADSMTVGEKHDSDQELFGLGMANIASAFFGGIPCNSAIARTAVNVRSGGKTRLAGVAHGVVIAVIVLSLGPLAAQVPLAALAGILMFTSFRMIEWHAVDLLKRSTHTEFSVMLLTWIVTVVFDLILAVEVGMVAAAVLFIKHMGDLNMISIPEINTPDGEPMKLGKNVAVFRVDGPLFFGAVERFVKVLEDAKDVKVVILRIRNVSSIDSTGIIALEEVYSDLKRRHCRLVLSGVQPSVLTMLERTGLLAKIGEENCFRHTEEAIRTMNRLMDKTNSKFPPATSSV